MICKRCCAFNIGTHFKGERSSSQSVGCERKARTDREEGIIWVNMEIGIQVT